MSDYLKNVIGASIRVENYLYLLMTFQDKTKGTSHSELHRRLVRMTPVIQSFLEPTYPVENLVAVPTASANRPEDPQFEKPSHPPPDSVHDSRTVETENAQAELQQLNQELLELRSREETQSLLHHELQSKINQQDGIINELQTQVSPQCLSKSISPTQLCISR